MEMRTMLVTSTGELFQAPRYMGRDGKMFKRDFSRPFKAYFGELNTIPLTKSTLRIFEKMRGYNSGRYGDLGRGFQVCRSLLTEKINMSLAYWCDKDLHLYAKFLNVSKNYKKGRVK